VLLLPTKLTGIDRMNRIKRNAERGTPQRGTERPKSSSFRSALRRSYSLYIPFILPIPV
jgi:hypothetical protein